MQTVPLNRSRPSRLIPLALLLAATVGVELTAKGVQPAIDLQLALAPPSVGAGALPVTLSVNLKGIPAAMRDRVWAGLSYGFWSDRRLRQGRHPARYRPTLVVDLALSYTAQAVTLMRPGKFVRRQLLRSPKQWDMAMVVHSKWGLAEHAATITVPAYALKKLVLSHPLIGCEAQQCVARAIGRYASGWLTRHFLARVPDTLIAAQGADRKKRGGARVSGPVGVIPVPVYRDGMQRLWVHAPIGGAKKVVTATLCHPLSNRCQRIGLASIRNGVITPVNWDPAAVVAGDWLLWPRPALSVVRP